MAAPRICFDRVIPSSYAPARAMAHAAAVSDYRSAVQKRAAAGKSAAKPFAMQVAALNQPLGTLHAGDPIAVARMALINMKKWDNAVTPPPARNGCFQPSSRGPEVNLAIR